MATPAAAHHGTGSFAFGFFGHAVADLTIEPLGGQIIRVHGTFNGSPIDATSSSVSRVDITTWTDDDILTLDLSTAPLDVILNVQAGDGTDTFTVEGSSSPLDATWTATGPTSAVLDLEASGNHPITLTGVEDATSTLDLTTLAIEPSMASSVTALTDAGASTLAESGGSGLPFTFTEPTTTLTVEPNDGASITIDPGFAAISPDVDVNGGDAWVTVDAIMGVGKDLLVDGQTVTFDYAKVEDGELLVNASRNIHVVGPVISENSVTDLKANASGDFVGTASPGLLVEAGIFIEGGSVTVLGRGTDGVGIAVASSGGIHADVTDLTVHGDGTGATTHPDIQLAHGAVLSAMDGVLTVTGDGGGLLTESGSTDVYHLLAQTINLGGHVQPGGSAGQLRTWGDVVMSPADTLRMEVNGLTPFTEHDQLQVVGDFDAGGATLVVEHDAGFQPSVGDKIVLVDNPFESSAVGTFAGLPEGAGIPVGGGTFYSLSYVGGDGNDVELTVVDRPRFSIADAPDQVEGDVGATSFDFLVSRTGASSPASVDWAVTSFDSDVDDFVGGVLPSGTVDFAAGEDVKAISVEVAGDDVAEPHEGFNVTLSNASQGARIATARAATTIINDDSTPGVPDSEPEPEPEPEPETEPCADAPEGSAPDAVGTVHQDDIECALHLQVMATRDDGDFEPATNATRGEIADAMVGVLAHFDVELPQDPDDAFSDDDGSEHEASVNVLVEMGLMNGTNDGRAAVGEPIRRDQFATMLSFVVAEVLGQPMPEGEDRFVDDDGTVHEGSINKLAAAGLTDGETETTFGIKSFVSRGAIAALTMRSVRYLAEQLEEQQEVATGP